MKFNEQLSTYLHSVSATQKELAEYSGLSTATISRFRSGKREPAYNSKELENLARALTDLAEKKQIPIGAFEEVYQTLRDSVEDLLRVDHDVFLGNLNYLLKYLGVRNTELAGGIHSDLSHVSRILAGTSNPGNTNIFIHEVATYLAMRYSGSNEIESIAKLLGVSPSDISTSAALRDSLVYYLGSHARVEVDDSIPRFLTALDSFDLNDYLKSVHFDEIRLPSAIPQLPTRKEYTGIKKMMESELDFMKTTVLSKSTADCILYSDMPLEEMASDPVFPKKYMLGMALMLKKGLHLHQIHDVNRPFQEMMLGLESWIPLYMTGQISPYYLPASQNQVFLHFLKVSGAAALEGTAIVGNQASGRYVLYRSREDVKHYRIRAKQLLSKAQPLMDIYRQDRAGLYHKLQRQALAGSDCKMICSNLPVYFLPEELLTRVLFRAGTDRTVRASVMQYYKEARESLMTLLREHTVHLVLSAPDDGQAGSGTPGLALADLFSDKEISLTSEEYAACTDALRETEAENENLRLEFDPTATFRHINIQIIGDKMVIVSKEKSPAIHFVIHHKKMIRAFRDFIPPIVDR